MQTLSSSRELGDELLATIAKERSLTQTKPNRLPPQLSKPFDVDWHLMLGCASGGPYAHECEPCPYSKSSVPDPTLRSLGIKLSERPIAFALRENQLRLPPLLKKPLYINVAPYSDVFHLKVSDDVLFKIFAAMKGSPHHRYFLQTRYLARARSFIERNLDLLPPYLWIGGSASSQATYDAVIQALLKIPAFGHYMSLEPLSGPIKITHVKTREQDIYYPLRGHVQAYVGMNKAGERLWEPLSAPSLLPIYGLRWLTIAGDFRPGSEPTNPRWVRNILRDASLSGVPAFFKGFGPWRQLMKIDPEDETMIFLAPSGEKRGRGAGSATNMLNQSFQGEVSELLSRKGDEHQSFYIDGKLRRERAPQPVVLKKKTSLL